MVLHVPVALSFNGLGVEARCRHLYEGVGDQLGILELPVLFIVGQENNLDFFDGLEHHLDGGEVIYWLSQRVETTFDLGESRLTIQVSKSKNDVSKGEVSKPFLAHCLRTIVIFRRNTPFENLEENILDHLEAVNEVILRLELALFNGNHPVGECIW